MLFWPPWSSPLLWQPCSYQPVSNNKVSLLFHDSSDHGSLVLIMPRNAPSCATMHHDPSHLGLVILLWNAHYFDTKYVKNNQQYVQSYLTSSMFLYHFMMGFFQVCHPSLDSLYLQTKFSKLIRSG